MLLLLASTQAHALEHGAAFRWRHGFLPSSILDIWYYDEDDEGAMGDRPNASMDVFGLEYQVSPEPTGTGFLFWAEYMPIHMDPGYWDDVESPEDHLDGDYLVPNKGFGTWNLGANYMYTLPFTDEAKPVWVGLSAGGGLGIGVVSGSVTLWHPGTHEDVVDTACGPTDIAPVRAQNCVSDGDVNLPSVLPVVDVTVGPMISIHEHARIRLDVGLHNVPFFGITGGGMF